jgi:predicted metal-dependent hydrolase
MTPGNSKSPRPKIDRLIRSSRRTLALIVELDGSVTVRAPRRTSQKVIEAFVAEKADWIAKKQAQAKQLAAARLELEKNYQPGETHLYLGTAYPLQRPTGDGCQVDFDGDRFALPAGCPDPAAAFEQWYRRAAQVLLRERVDALAAAHGYTVQRVRITGARTRWGSCSSTGSLNFSWRLVQAPPGVIDYVVIHELVHLEHRNHSKAFWGRVAELQPDYGTRRAWLRQHGGGLVA